VEAGMGKRSSLTLFEVVNGTLKDRTNTEICNGESGRGILQWELGILD
jgi:hypothetical protein